MEFFFRISKHSRKVIFQFSSWNCFFQLNEKGHEPSRAENSSSRAMARASSARTHHYRTVNGKFLWSILVLKLICSWPHRCHPLQYWTSLWLKFHHGQRHWYHQSPTNLVWGPDKKQIFEYFFSKIMFYQMKKKCK